MSVCLYACMSTLATAVRYIDFLAVCLCVCPSVCLSVCVFVCLSVLLDIRHLNSSSLTTSTVIRSTTSTHSAWKLHPSARSAGCSVCVSVCVSVCL